MDSPKNDRIRKCLTALIDKYDVDDIKKEKVACDDLISWCKSTIVKFQVIKAILSPLGAMYEEFYTKSEYILEKEKNITKIFQSYENKQVNTRPCIRAIYEIVETDTMSIVEVFTILETVSGKNVSKCHCYELILHILKEKYTPSSIEDFKQMYSEKYDFVNTIDSFAKQSDWKQGIIDHLKTKHRNRMINTSAFLEKTLLNQMFKNVSTLTKIEKYVEDKLFNKTNVENLRWFLSTADSNMVRDALIEISGQLVPCNDRVKSMTSKHHAREFVVNSLSLFKKYLNPFVRCKHEIQSLSTDQILDKIENARDEPVSERRHFYQEEIDKLFEQARKSKKSVHRDMLMLTILREVGLRISALSSIQTKHFRTPDGATPRETTILEKGNKTRTFPISENLKVCIKNYMETYSDVATTKDAYIFHKHKQILLSCGSSVTRSRLQNLAKKAGVFGMHIHPHAFRHTIVNTLMDQGNKLENVSRYMGHSSVTTTEQYYWTSNLSNIVPIMNIPWLKPVSTVVYGDEDYDDNDDNSDIKSICPESESGLTVDLMVSLLGVYHEVLTHEQKFEIKRKVPNITDIFSMIYKHAESTYTSSLSSNTTTSSTLS
jgi:site-specific recombinase XerD